MSKEKKEYMSFALDIKSVDEETGEIEGYASTFGNVDQGYDIVDKGAFKKTLKENKGIIPILADHNPTKHIGYNKKAIEDDVGLKVFGQLDIANNQTAKEKYSLAKMALKLGTKLGLSIGYYTIKAEPDKDFPNVRRLKELKLVEYSITPFPMNQQASMTGAKSAEFMNDSEFEQAIAKLFEMGKTKEDVIELLSKAAEPKEDFHSLFKTIENFNNTIKGDSK